MQQFHLMSVIHEELINRPTNINYNTPDKSELFIMFSIILSWKHFKSYYFTFCSYAAVLPTSVRLRPSGVSCGLHPAVLVSSRVGARALWLISSLRELHHQLSTHLYKHISTRKLFNNSPKHSQLRNLKQLPPCQAQTHTNMYIQYMNYILGYNTTFRRNIASISRVE